MAARRFALPDIQDLSKDQERVRLLPTDGRYLVVGGPGTGKSIVALLRARRHHKAAATGAAASQEYVFLAYNKLLIAASRELMGGQVNAQTWIGWLRSAYRAALKAPCPTRDGKPYELDWPAIGAAIAAAAQLPPAAPPYLVIDEGQDMPPAFYRTLADLGFEHYFVVADQNQRITDRHSTVREIEDCLALESRDRIELRDNYRNSYPVARLALSFWVDDPASPCTRLPTAGRSARTPLLVDYGEGCRLDLAGVAARILKAADRDPARLIGILTPDDETRRRWLAALRETPVALDCERARIATYAMGEDAAALRFSEGGILVLNAQSAKGLELDWALLADIDRYRCNPEDPRQMDELRRRFYVLVSRARERVILFRQSGRPCPVEALLPTDPAILERWGRV